VYPEGAGLEHTGLPLVGSVELPIVLDFALSVIWIAGVINAMNLIDGLDGLAAGVTFFVAVTNLVLSLHGGNALGAFFSATIAGAVVGFLIFNWNPAIIFMGDTGSMFLGYILATTSIMTSQKMSTAVAMGVVAVLVIGIVRFFGFFNVSQAVRGAMHHSQLESRLRRELPDFTAGMMYEAGSLDDVWERLCAMCGKCEFKSVSWRSVGVKPTDERREELLDENSARYEKEQQRGFLKIHTSAAIDTSAYIEIKITYPARLGKLTQEGDTVLQLTAEVVGRALGRTIREGKWGEGATSIARKSPAEKQPRDADREAVVEQEAVFEQDAGNGLDGAWEMLVESCRACGFLGVGWHSVGLKPPDERDISFDGQGWAHGAIIRKSVAVGQLSFLEVRFLYRGKRGKRASTEIRHAARRIERELRERLIMSH